MYTKQRPIAAAIVAAVTLAGALGAGPVDASSTLEPTVLAPLPGFDASEANGTNDRGDVVGQSSGVDGYIATLWDRRENTTSLEPLPGHDAAILTEYSTVADGIIQLV